MNRPYFALFALLAFSFYTAWSIAISEQSLLAFGFELLSRPDTAQVVIDLYLLASLAALWMYRDARGKGRSLLAILPYLALTAVFVSLGPLAYIVVEGFRSKPSPRGCA